MLMPRSDTTLIIWDFDGVISDSDYIWAANWATVLKERYDIELTKEQVRSWLIGISEKEKAARLEANLPVMFKDKLSEKFGNNIPKVLIDEKFTERLNKLHEEAMNDDTRLKLTPGVKEIFEEIHNYDKYNKYKRVKQCIATGGTKHQSDTKNRTVGILKYFQGIRNCFTVDMLKKGQKGKPEPYIFLLAASEMGVPAKDCIVIEDSIDGIRAAKRAKMAVIAFVGAEANNNPEYKKKCLENGADMVVDNMEELHKILDQQLKKQRSNLLINNFLQRVGIKRSR